MLRAFLVFTVSCASAPATQPRANSSPARGACVVGQFVSAFEDDGHGVMVKLSAARTSATGYAPSSEQQFYVHDAGNPTRGLRPGDEVWLIEATDATWPWRHLAADQARVRCPPR